MSRQVSRRQFLSGGAAAAVLPTALPASELFGALTSCRGGKLTDIEHVVIFMQENRSFDHYFGTYKGVRGFDDRSAPRAAGAFAQASGLSPAVSGYPDPLLPFHLDTAVSVPPRQGVCSDDIKHQWTTQHDAWNRGANDAWLRSHIASDPTPTKAALTMGYYTRADLPFYYALADHFTICDGYHSSLIGGTDLNRLYAMTATMDPDGWDGGCQFLETKVAPSPQTPGADLGAGGKWMPYPEVLTKAGVSWKAYGTPDGLDGDNVLRYFPQYRPVGGDPALAAAAFGSATFPVDFAADCATGRLPAVSWLFASLADTEHAPAPITWGESIVHSVLSALVTSSLWSKTALFVTYDENGGFFDHVPPPTAPPGTPGEYLNVAAMSAAAKTEVRSPTGRDTSGEPIGLGFRVPMLVVSPFSRNAAPGGPPLVASDLFDHTSTLRFLETWTTARGTPARVPDRDAGTRRPGLSAWRRSLVGDLTAAFNFDATPDASVPTDLLTIVPNRADPRVLTECIITGTPVSVTDQTAPAAPDPVIVAATSLPVQELTAGVRRPSGLCVAALQIPPRGLGRANKPVLPATGAIPRWWFGAALSALGGALWLRRRSEGPAS